MSFFIGVDVGSGSARAALVSDTGKIINVAVKEIKTWNYDVFYEQSSNNIWQTCIACIKDVIRNIPPDAIKGIGFDATCSLVVLDKNGKPLTVSRSGNNEQNIILWMDHRASKEAEKITSLKHDILKYVGGKISLEMETPKLLWLKNNMKEECWDKAGLFFDLPDFLTWKATNCESRSLCSLVCKWTYEIRDDNVELGWNKSYFTQIGLSDLLEDNARKIGSKVQIPGTPVGNGLSKEIAAELGLVVGTPVGTSIIDAHAGGLGLIGCSAEGVDADFQTRLSRGLICGTSTCHMAISKTPVFTPGIWGPYYSAMVPGMWLNEGGQSATGKLIDYIIETHPAYKSVTAKLSGNMHIQTYLSDMLNDMKKRNGYEHIDYLTKDLHVFPDFHGNRSPIADSTMKGAICGLTISPTDENMALLYLATIQALSYGTRHILETLQASGYASIKSILICGGLSKNPLFTKIQADVTNLPVLYPDEVESVLVGASILGACAAKHFPDIFTAVTTMGGKGTVIKPTDELKSYHDKKYKVFLKMLKDQLEYKSMMMN